MYILQLSLREAEKSDVCIHIAVVQKGVKSDVGIHIALSVRASFKSDVNIATVDATSSEIRCTQKIAVVVARSDQTQLSITHSRAVSCCTHLIVPSVAARMIHCGMYRQTPTSAARGRYQRDGLWEGRTQGT